jgi:diadenosine tetraphosphate (Ap4A) HIT family hydrolase
MDTERIVSLVFGEEVSHAHVWLVPRFKNDGHGGAIDLKNIKDINEEEMKKIQEKIQSALRVKKELNL